MRWRAGPHKVCIAICKPPNTISLDVVGHMTIILVGTWGGNPGKQEFGRKVAGKTDRNRTPIFFSFLFTSPTCLSD
jgi:hypothetical protein